MHSGTSEERSTDGCHYGLPSVPTSVALRRFSLSATCMSIALERGAITEGRLCWGIDDFDEAFPLAYTNNLVRLAASLKVVLDAESLSIKLKD